MERCDRCERELTRDDIAIYKKMVSRTGERFCCIECVAEHFEVDPQLIYDKIQHFRAMGCTLFCEKQHSAAER